jgi:Cytosine deaminase and related metal-dependent hydrolases
VIRLRCRWLYRGTGKPLEDQVLSIHHGRIESIDHAGAQAPTLDAGDVAIIPGLVNCHTHLEFTHLTTPLEPRREFARWIETVIWHRRGWVGDVVDSIDNGLEESLREGVTALAETATSDWLFSRSDPQSPPRMLVFREILGLRESGVVDQLSTAELFLKNAAQREIPNVGLSPHAPYSLHPELFRGLCDLAVSRNVPLSMHLAESPAELELLESGTGPLVDLFTQMGLWQPDVIPRGTKPLAYLKELARAPRALVIHGNLLDDEEIRFLESQPQMSVVYCPRTHAAMQESVHPWMSMRERGINVVLGTDSRASNPDLSLWNELAHLHQQFPALPASELLPMITAKAARALGWDDLGFITPGARANLCLVRLPSGGEETPETHLLRGTIERVMLAGHWVR